MKLKIGALTIVLIVFSLFSVYGIYNNLQMSVKLDSACDKIQTDILAGSTSIFASEEQFISCISQKDDARIKASMNMLSLIIFIFLGLLSWKFDRLKKKS